MDLGVQFHCFDVVSWLSLFCSAVPNLMSKGLQLYTVLWILHFLKY